MLSCIQLISWSGELRCMENKKFGERQIIGRRGIPVEIASNEQSRFHPEKTTLAVGGLIRVEDLKEQSSRERSIEQKRSYQISKKFDDLTVARLRIKHPGMFENFEYTNSALSDREADRIFEWERNEVLAENPELIEEWNSIHARYEAAKGMSYDFAKSDHSKDDIYVGKEGTLVYSEVDGKNVAEEILESRKTADRYLKDKTGNVRANYSEMENLPDGEWYQKVAQMFRDAGKTVDIHQIEVLEAAQNKGVATALLDVAHWDIKDQRRADFAVARVSERNFDRDKTLALFEKNGYRKLYIPNGSGDESYFLVFRMFNEK